MMDLRSSMLVGLAPEIYDKKLPVSERETILELPEMELNEYKIVHKEYPIEKRYDLLGGGGYIRYDGPTIIRALLHNDKIWMSDSPSEIRDMKGLSSLTHGNVLLAGLGMGLLATLSAQRDKVNNILVIEISPEIIQMISPYLSDKVTVEQADFRKWIREPNGHSFDTAILDIWGNFSLDDLPDMLYLWELVEQQFNKPQGGVWGIDYLIGKIQDNVRGYGIPSDTASQLYDLELPEIADWIIDNCPDEEYGDEDEVIENPDLCEWYNSGQDDEMVWQAFIEVYNLEL